MEWVWAGIRPSPVKDWLRGLMGQDAGVWGWRESQSPNGGAAELRERFSREFCARSALLLGFAFPGQVGAVGAFVGLNVLELSGLVADGVEFLAGGTAVGGAACFGWHNDMRFRFMFAMGGSSLPPVTATDSEGFRDWREKMNG